MAILLYLQKYPLLSPKMVLFPKLAAKLVLEFRIEYNSSVVLYNSVQGNFFLKVNKTVRDLDVPNV